MLTEQQIKKYQDLCKEHFDLVVSREEALVQCEDLVQLMKQIISNKIKNYAERK